MSNEKPINDMLATILPGLSMTQKMNEARAERDRKKAAYEASQKVVDSYNKEENREQIREQKRRDEIIGHVFSGVWQISPEMWAQFQPHLLEWLEEAPDKDRVLFGLSPMKGEDPIKADTESGSKAAAAVKNKGKKEGQGTTVEPPAAVKTEGKKEGEGATVEPPVEPAQPGDPRGES